VVSNQKVNSIATDKAEKGRKTHQDESHQGGGRGRTMTAQPCRIARVDRLINLGHLGDTSQTPHDND
jgi:hypothetical protein